MVYASVVPVFAMASLKVRVLALVTAVTVATPPVKYTMLPSKP
jgi:hypothetical protein